jgi:hypothetical protein
MIVAEVGSVIKIEATWGTLSGSCLSGIGKYVSTLTCVKLDGPRSGGTSNLPEYSLIVKSELSIILFVVGSQNL